MKLFADIVARKQEGSLPESLFQAEVRRIQQEGLEQT